MKQGEELIKAYASGTPVRALMQQYQLGKGTVLRVLDEAGVTRKPNCPSDEELEEAKRLYLVEKWSLERIGKHLGFSASTIYRHFMLQGVPIRHQPDGRSLPE